MGSMRTARPRTRRALTGLVATAALVACDAPSGPGSTVRFPLDAWHVIQDFGVWNESWNGFHLAEDADVRPGTPVFAIADGVVVGAWVEPDAPGYGAVLLIEHDIHGDTVTSLYGHVSSRRGVLVSAGEGVSKGQVVAFVADDDEDGGAWTPHLHFGIRKGAESAEHQICGIWPYVGYTRACDAISHDAHRALWLDPTNFLLSNGAALPGR